MPITSWSYSRLTDFEACKFRAYLKYDQKIPEPERPLPPGKSEHANDRGTRVHEGCELYVKGEIDQMPPEAEKHFGPQIDLIKHLHEEGQVSLEGEWGMDDEWNISDWRSAWFRLKLDAFVSVTDTQAVVIDYKTGKKWGNEIKHGEQLQLYAITSFLRHPDLITVDAELWYLDVNEVTRVTYEREQALRLRQKFHNRAIKLTTAKDFPPNPNIYSCRWCPYGPWGTGHCERGVQR